jgi:glucosamine-6-phosphate deaminase
MRVIKVKDYEEMSSVAASMVSGQVMLKPESVLGLATGDTPLGMYQNLINMYEQGTIDFSEVTTFNLDEYYGIPKTNHQSYYYYMMENFFQHININKENINIPNGMAEDIEKECKNYENKIKKINGIDLQILGIGVNGHIGFNEPDVNFEAETHLVMLDEKTIQSNARFFESIEEVPTKAISMGIKTIISSRKIVLLANGRGKAEAVEQMVKGKISPEMPASILQLHKDVTVIVDEEAGSRL